MTGPPGEEEQSGYKHRQEWRGRQKVGKSILCDCLFVFPIGQKDSIKHCQKYLEAANIGFTCNFHKESQITYAAVCQVP